MWIYSNVPAPCHDSGPSCVTACKNRRSQVNGERWVHLHVPLGSQAWLSFLPIKDQYQLRKHSREPEIHCCEKTKFAFEGFESSLWVFESWSKKTPPAEIKREPQFMGTAIWSIYFIWNQYKSNLADVFVSQHPLCASCQCYLHIKALSNAIKSGLTLPIHSLRVIYVFPYCSSISSVFPVPATLHI